jgi:D-serine deaminase-like pyridoxal phosphate-dependent protein
VRGRSDLRTENLGEPENLRTSENLNLVNPRTLEPWNPRTLQTATIARMRLCDLPTPAVLIERSRLERNIDRMQAACDAQGKRLRPHAKTHKSPAIARRQIARGAVGICCAKLGEAEAFADAGIEDIRLPYPIHPVNARRAMALADRVRLSFIVDDPDVARAWSGAFSDARREVDVLIKVDVGFHRCGIDPHASGAADVVREIASLPGLRFRGLLSHAGHGYAAFSDADAEAVAVEEARTLGALADLAGVHCEEISVGATPTARFSVRQPGITELRPGNYAYVDRTQVALGSAAWGDCALTVLARVVSRPAPDRIILDSGSKTLTNDLARGNGNTAGYGAVLADVRGSVPNDSLLVERLSEEHATVRATTGASALRTGDLVRVVPNHSCVVSNLVDRVWLVDGDAVVEELTVAARGRIT